ncbi:sensor domain-containing diguanylate cyclase [Peribacillus alkalitolerans]|uniref:sensor domain-containing diguanylate cyclase n=1 Tax=Peribacillus alkalitolerans TaxID=1550385 RepID=UPI0013D4ABBE|nr:sensor domain-containing diguanylate cyclase [Peribacillus alkalitolerans]
MGAKLSELNIELKSALFDLLDFEDAKVDYETLLVNILENLKRFFEATEVSFYKLNEWKRKLYLEASTDSFKKNIYQDQILMCEVLEGTLRDKTYYYNNFPFAGFTEYQLIVPLNLNSLPLSFLAFKEGNSSLLRDEESYVELTRVCGKVLEKVHSITGIISEEKRYRQLYRVTEKFHSSMDMDSVLEEIIETLKEVYPTFTYYLLLSHDNHSRGNLPIKDLEYDSENIAAMQSYVTGQTQFEDDVIARKSILYAPLKGKQGVYGVLQVIAPDTVLFPKNEIEFISLLANTAGSALENAQLYHQSKRLISDLQLINETSHRLNSNLRLSDTMNYMKEQITSSFHAEEIGFIMISAENEINILPGTTSFFESPAACRYVSFIKERINQNKESLFIGDLSLPGEVADSEYKSVMAVPMVQSGSLKGFAVVMHSDPYYFSFEVFKLLQSLIHHSTLAFTNSLLREELEKMVVTDHLTKLYSRNYLDEKLQESMENDTQGTFILFDIDNFKRINDSFGHQVGDRVLVQVADLIKGSIRNGDIGARWGGEELAVYLPRVPIEIGQSIAERISNKVSEYSNPGVTVSCGVSYWNHAVPDSTFSLFKRADDALYIAKNSGKNKVIVEKRQ